VEAFWRTATHFENSITVEKSGNCESGVKVGWLRHDPMPPQLPDSEVIGSLLSPESIARHCWKLIRGLRVACSHIAQFLPTRYRVKVLLINRGVLLLYFT